MPVTKTTRRGNGTGRGGPPRGGVSNSKAGKPGPGRPPGLRTGEGKAALVREMIAEKAESLATQLLTLATTPGPMQLGALNSALAKMGVTDKQEIDITTREEPLTPEQRRARIAELVAKLGGAGGPE